MDVKIDSLLIVLVVFVDMSKNKILQIMGKKRVKSISYEIA